MAIPVMNEHSVIFVDKPAGITSFGAVARVRRQLSQQLGKKAKVGHTGTLDPFATGLMIIVTGKECRNAGQYSKLDKVYEATIHLGAISTTGDPEGEIAQMTPEAPWPTLEAIKVVLGQFTGKITQIPPQFSAIKVNGQRAYNLARKGEAVEIPPRQVTIYSLELISYNYPELKVRAHVSSGTYVRTLAEDIGKALGTGAYCSQLRRTKVGEWGVEGAVKIEK